MEHQRLSQPRKQRIKLKDVPPLNPLTAPPAYSHTEKNRENKMEAEALSMVKDTADTTNTAKMEDKFIDMTDNSLDKLQKLHVDTGTPEKGLAKLTLNEICVKNDWKPPMFECVNEEGPSHMKKFIFKVIVDMKHCTILECYGKPFSRKKIAAESAAEGALWYLGRTGYHIKKR